MNIETAVAVGSFIFGIGGTLWAVLQWYALSQTKRYAAERDFQHLRNNQEQMASNLKLLFDEVEEIGKSVNDLTRLASILLARSGNDTFSDILHKKT